MSEGGTPASSPREATSAVTVSTNIFSGSVLARALGWSLRIGLGALFIVAGVLKWQDPSRFALEIANYQLVPAWAPYLAMLLPGVEVIAGIAVIVSPARWRQGAALVLAGLVLMFTAAAVTVLARGINIDCGCFGSHGGPVGTLTIARDVGLLAAAAALVCGAFRTS